MLLPEHQKLIDDSKISREVADARGYRTVIKKAELGSLGFGRNQQIVPALLIPVRDVTGNIATYLIRPDEPRIKDGKALKYEIPSGSRMVLDVPVGARDGLANPGVPLFITEGSRKADAAVSAGLCCVSLIGVWCWRGTNEHGGKTLLPDFESIALNHREVYVVFDSDVMTKAGVRAALERFIPALKQREARVRAVYLPSGEGGTKVGLDDFLAAGNSVGDLLQLAQGELRQLPAETHPTEYALTDQCLVWNQRARNGVTPVQLTNFSARIVADVVRDDGAEQQRFFEIETRLRDHEARFRVAAGDFDSLSWVSEHARRAVAAARDHMSSRVEDRHGRSQGS